MSRSTTANASATKRDRVHSLELLSGESLPVSVDFTAILGATPALSSATWSTANPSIAVMASAEIDGNVSRIALTAGAPGATTIRCVGGTDDGSRFVQLFVLQVSADETVTSYASAGPSSLEATAVVVGGGDTGGGILDGGGA